ncbi:Hypothetical predicted protein [Paramuricea clavata]|uniref:Uncharacterized protein n=1 Tax=Paramuricea clavata TaxID=317549 RepID=A0A7D9LHU8_PARCT|nr:Hypothetical predicted protein [Paramuricea clavata]
MIAIMNRHSGLMVIMQRMQSLRLMPSHSYFYKKLTQFGKDHDKEIIDAVENEGKRLTALGKSEQMQKEEDEQSPTTKEKLNVSILV